MNKTWYAYLLWTLAAAVLSFSIAMVFAGRLRLPRAIYLIPYVGLVSVFFFLYIRWSGLNIISFLRHNWYWGLLGAVIVGFFMVRNILEQPASEHAQGIRLAVDIVWLGFVYGAVDGLLLSVFPIITTRAAFATLGWTAHWYGKIGVGALGLVASFVTILIYHLGYPECQSKVVFEIGGGQSLVTATYLLANNPFSAVVSHVAMHIAGVLRGPESVMQLPPHY
jgi:hypothetical protein